MGRTILVTGAGGFIGSAVTRRLVRWAEADAELWNGEPVGAVCALLRPGSSTDPIALVTYPFLATLGLIPITWWLAGYTIDSRVFICKFWTKTRPCRPTPEIVTNRAE